MTTTDISHDQSNRRFAFPFALLTIAFILRVLGQVVQRWSPVDFLPPFDEWQGSSLPYPVLLGAQIAILAVAGYVIWRMSQEATVIRSSLIPPVMIFGVLYFSVMALRIVLGLTILADVDWFTSWISSSFHLVLAVQVLIIGVYQRKTSALWR